MNMTKYDTTKVEHAHFRLDAHEKEIQGIKGTQETMNNSLRSIKMILWGILFSIIGSVATLSVIFYGWFETLKVAI